MNFTESSRRWIRSLRGCAALCLLAGCIIVPLPPDDGSGDNSGGGGGNAPQPGPNPTPGNSVQLLNQSTAALSLTYRIEGAASQGVFVSAGQTQTIANVPACKCFTVDNFTPSGGSETEGFSIEVCAPATATFSNAFGPFLAITTALSGGGASTGPVTFNLQNNSGRDLVIFPFVNGAARASFNFGPGAGTAITVDRCQRLRVLARSATNSFPDVSFVESPATTAGVYTYESFGNIVQVLKQP